MKPLRWILLAATVGLVVARGEAVEGPTPREAGTDSKVQLRLSAGSGPFRVGDTAPVTLRLVNSGDKPVALVFPGDGSGDGWRTPILGVSVLLPAAGNAQHPKDPPIRTAGRCGNINALKPKEVFELAPGEGRALTDWTVKHRFSQPGRYRIVYYYRNDPSLEWKGVPLGVHDPEAMARVKASHRCSLRSNELVFEVKP